MRYVELVKPGMTSKKKAKLCVIKSRNIICNAAIEEAFFATRTDLSAFELAYFASGLQVKAFMEN